MFDWLKKVFGSSEPKHRRSKAPEPEPEFKPAKLPPRRSEQKTTTASTRSVAHQTANTSKVAELLKDDRWSVAHGVAGIAPYIIRFRMPVLSPPDTAGYPERLTIFWPYAEESSGALPSDADTAALEEFEERLCAALEHDGHAIVTAVLTFDGARQWVVYTSDFRKCGERIGAMPQNKEPYPIDMEAANDPDWKYLRDEILKRVQPNI